MSSSLNVAIGVSGALIGSGMGAYLTAKFGLRSRSQEWLRDQQASALNQILTIAAANFIELNRRYRRVVAEPMDWDPWRRAVTQGAIVLSGSVFEKVRALDAQTFILNLAVKNSPRDMGDDVWQTLAMPWRAARDQLVDASREAYGLTGHLGATGGRPPADADVWRTDYWARVFADFDRQQQRESPVE